MPEPITIVAGVTTIVGNVWRISKDVSDLIEGIENAPKHILAVSQDVRGLYGVLGPLQGLLQDLKGDRLPENVVPIFEGLQQPLDHCFWAFRELQMKICKYTKPMGDIRRSKWTAFRWQFTEKDTNAYRAHLASYKLTVDVAFAAANLWVLDLSNLFGYACFDKNRANTSQTIQATHSLERQIQTMRIQLAGLEQNSADDPYSSIDVDNGSQVTDRKFALRRFLETAETAFSGSPPISPKLSPKLSATRRPSLSPPASPRSSELEFDIVVPGYFEPGRTTIRGNDAHSRFNKRRVTKPSGRRTCLAQLRTDATAVGNTKVPPFTATEHLVLQESRSGSLERKEQKRKQLEIMEETRIQFIDTRHPVILFGIFPFVP
jgi:hypothetical protein